MKGGVGGNDEPTPARSDAAHSSTVRPCLVTKFGSKIYYAKRRFSVVSKCRHMYEILNVDKIKN